MAKRYIIRDAEAGNEIAEFNTYEEADAEMNKYYERDLSDGIYEEDFYEIVEKEVYIVDFYSVDVKYAGDFNDYTQAEWRAKAEYECDHGVDAYDYSEEVETFEEARKLEDEFNYVADNRFPCNKLAYVTWAQIREQDWED